jgi:hypothetical protein
MGVSVWLELDRLMALPLDAVARATLARELLTLLSTDAVASNHVQLRDTLEMWLLEDELDRCRRLGQDGEWLEALQRMEALLPQLEQRDVGDIPVDVLWDLIRGIHRAIVEEERAVATDERDELLWQVHRWLQRGGVVELPPHHSLDSIREQICRFGALAWLARVRTSTDEEERLRALRRSMTLLLNLAAQLDPCPTWVLQGLREGLQRALLAEPEALLPPADLHRWALGYVDYALPQQLREKASDLLRHAEAALEVGRALRLPSFPPTEGS